MITIEDFFFPANSFPNDDIIELLDNNTKENVNFVKVTNWIDGSLMDSTKLDGVIYRAKGTDFYAREVVFSKAPLNVKWFGAKGDGISDDTASIQTAFGLLFKLRESSISTIYFPGGDYLVTAMLVFPAGCELVGYGKMTTKIFTNDNTYNLINIYENINFSENPNNNAHDKWPWTSFKEITLAGKHRDANIFGSFPISVTDNVSNSGIIFSKVSRSSLENVIIKGFETAGVFYNSSLYHRLNNALIQKNKIGILATETCTTIHGVNSEFRFNSIGHSINDSYGCSFVNCVFEANLGQYMINRIDYNTTPDSHNGVAVYLNNSFDNVYSNCYFEMHVCTFYLVNSNSNTINNSFICAGTNNYFTNLDGNSGFLNNSKNNVFEKNFHYAAIAEKAKFYLSSTSEYNHFEFMDKETLDDFVSRLDDINNFADKTKAPKAICKTENILFENGVVTPVKGNLSVSSAQRPLANDMIAGFQIFDTTLNKPIWSDGTDWRDSFGTIV